jgi:hypothetical protein
MNDCLRWHTEGRPANSNRSPRLVREPRSSANTGENPPKCWTWADGVRLGSRMFGGLGDRNRIAVGAQTDRKRTAGVPYTGCSRSYCVSSSRNATSRRAWTRNPLASAMTPRVRLGSNGSRAAHGQTSRGPWSSARWLRTLASVPCLLVAPTQSAPHSDTCDRREQGHLKCEPEVD